PNLITAAKERGAKLALLSARLSESSVRGWARAPGAARAVLGAFDLVMPQDDETAARLARFGALEAGRLNLKLVGDPLPVDEAAWAEAETTRSCRPLLLAASTHPGEEALAMDAFAPLSLRDALLVLVPRHPDRGAEVAAMVRARGWDTARRSEGAPFGSSRIYVADTLGELGLWFRLAGAALLGGGHAPGVGGHNPLEPARLHCPTASGPAVDNWRSVFEGLRRADAVAIAPDAYALEAFWRRACYRDPTLGEQAARAAAFAAAQSGQLDEAVSRLLDLLP
ncbi:MAG: 3-deoxy-D-manno-octulosonic acid transferase, partial [Pseudomonadota bacterium]|nr:3-deoxy-D-manno-octulosonic acid transferase [Pseudomonadota bacterium]